MNLSLPVKSKSKTLLQKRIDEKIYLLKKLELDIAAITIIHDLRDTSVIYMSPRGLKILGITMRELIAIGPDYHARFFNMEFAEGYMPKIFGLIERNNNDEIISFFQQVRSSPDKDWTWYLSCTKILMRDEEGKPLLIITNAVPMDAEHYIEAAKAQRMLDENSFLRRNEYLFNSLTKREKEILKLMAMGLSSAQMAKKLHISEMTATTHRRNIKSKLNAETNYDITKFAQAFDLI
jgi:DNA-binding CsgD family transcriptional regulator